MTNQNPTSKLDDKLREILQTPHTDSTGSTVMTFPTQKTFDQIKQAIADEGYTHQYKLHELQRVAGLMTGAEWYDRFCEQFELLHRTDEGFYRPEDVYEVAKRAAGLEEQA